jgi:outer membrane immunogenic protein
VFPKIASTEPIPVSIRRSPAPSAANPIKPTTGAYAAVPALPAVLPLQPTTWTGFYFGSYFGLARLNATEAVSSTSVLSSASTFDFGPNGSFGSNTGTGNFYSQGSAGGSHTGGTGSLSIGWQSKLSPNFVAGVQVDGGLSNIQARLSGNAINTSFSTGSFVSTTRCPACVPPNPTSSSTSSSFSSGMTSINDTLANRWFVSALAKGGLLVSPNSLVYALGGWSYANFEAPSVQTSFGTNGLVVGAGIERRISPAWSLKAEYRYTKFQNTTVSLPSGSVNNGTSSTDRSTTSSFAETATRFSIDTHTALVGIARNFDLY